MPVTRMIATNKVNIPQSSQTVGIQEFIGAVDRGLVFGGFGGSSSTGGGTPPPPPPPPATGTGAATVPTGPSANLQALLAAIPIAMDGQVITADHHNSLRSALIGMANQLGMGLTSPTTAYTFSPAFLPVTATPAPAAWTISTSFSAVSTVSTNPDGWLPIQLPNGQNIQSMTVTGKLTAPAPATFVVTLFRESITPDGTGPAPLITLPLQTQSGVFSVSGSIVPSGAANAAGLVAQLALVQDLKLIDTSNYKYFLRGTVTTAGTGTIAEIDAIQIVVGN